MLLLGCSIPFVDEPAPSLSLPLLSISGEDDVVALRERGAPYLQEARDLTLKQERIGTIADKTASSCLLCVLGNASRVPSAVRWTSGT